MNKTALQELRKQQGTKVATTHFRKINLSSMSEFKIMKMKLNN